MYTVAHISSLVYLDYRLIDDETALERKQKAEEEKVAQTMLYKVGQLKSEILSFEMCQRALVVNFVKRQNFN